MIFLFIFFFLIFKNFKFFFSFFFLFFLLGLERENRRENDVIEDDRDIDFFIARRTSHTSEWNLSR
jgi:hypothetical protein